MAATVRTIFKSVVVEVEVGDFRPEFTWQRVSRDVYAAIKESTALIGLQHQLKTQKELGLLKPKKELSALEKKALKMKPFTVLELAEQYLIGWSGVPGDEGDLEFCPEAVKDVCANVDWIRVLEETFFAAQDKVPDIVIKNVSTPDAGGRLAGTITPN